MELVASACVQAAGPLVFSSTAITSLNFAPSTFLPSFTTSNVNFQSQLMRESIKRGAPRRPLARQAVVSPRNVAMQDSLAGIDEDGQENEPRKYPIGLQRYESMVVLRPDLSEDERNALTERYEEALVAGGALDVEMFNRGMQPLAYDIKTKNMGGTMNQYLDGIYLLFTYVTKPESQISLQKTLNADDDIIRSSTFRLKI